MDQEPRDSSARRFWLRVSHETVVKLLVRDAVIWRLPWDGESFLRWLTHMAIGSLFWFLASYWWSCQFLVMWTSPYGCLYIPTFSWLLPKQVVQEGARQKPLVFYDLVLEVNHHLSLWSHFLIKNKSVSPAYTQRRNSKLHLLKGMSKNLWMHLKPPQPC